MNGLNGNSLAEPVRILSDLHLGHPASLVGGVDRLAPLLEGAGTVVFNGDTFEESHADWRPRGMELLDELRTLCAVAGAAPVLLAGNHDPELPRAGWLHLAGGRVLVTHGHMLYDVGAPWRHEYLDHKAEIRAILAERGSGGDDLARRWDTTQRVTRAMVPEQLAGARRSGKGWPYLLSALWPPERLFHILRVWAGHVGAAERFLERHDPGARVLVYGHVHRAGVWRRGARRFCNTGAFMRGARPLVAEIAGDTLRVHRVQNSGGAFRIGTLRETIGIS